MNRRLVLVAVPVTAILVYVVVTLPPRRAALASWSDGTVAGILHVHTNRSDGLSSPEEVAAAAARAGLKFLVFTDHGDATRTPDPPAYRSGVLCLDGVEISTNGGHYIAIDMPAAPYPLGGDPRDVVEDVRRLGGFGIVAHPDSPKPQLRWNDWEAPFDAIELLNLDTSWRVLAAQSGWQSKRRLVTAFLDYPFRAPEVIASLIQPTGALGDWQTATAGRRVVSIAGADAHARLAARNGDPGDTSFALPLPGYQTSFGVLSVHVRPDRPFKGDARDDAAALMGGMRSGHLYTAIDAVAWPPSFEFTATTAQGTVQEGDEIGVNPPVGGARPVNAEGPTGALWPVGAKRAVGQLQLRVQSNAPARFTTRVYEGLKTISSVRDTGDSIVHVSDRPAVYWAEIADLSRVPSLTWIRSNPIYVRARAARLADAPRETVVAQPIFDGRSTRGWSVEHDSMSASAVETALSQSGSNELRFRYGLGGGAVAGQVAALAVEVPAGIAMYERVAFTIRSERPMRISVQLRDGSAHRWQRSIYVDETARTRTVSLDDFAPTSATTPRHPSLGSVRSILFVVDTTNTKPGVSGRIWIRDAALQK